MYSLQPRITRAATPNAAEKAIAKNLKEFLPRFAFLQCRVAAISVSALAEWIAAPQNAHVYHRRGAKQQQPKQYQGAQD
jgi:hypothetical protein